MSKEIFPNSNIPVRKTKDLLPTAFKTPSNEKFFGAVLDPLVQPGTLDKKVGYVGRRYGKTYKSQDVYLDTDETLRSRYQLEPAVIVRSDTEIENFYDYLDFKNQIKFFGHEKDRDDIITDQEHYSWNPPIDWDKFINYREYYWVPEGPPPVTIFGQSLSIISSYRVSLGSGSVYLFSPDGLTNNPTITLYRGQTYKFSVNVPGQNFVIRTSLDGGTLVYDPISTYERNQIVLYDNKFWQAQSRVLPAGPGQELDTTSGIWKLLETTEEQRSAFDYDIGVTNNRSERGTIVFEVPFNAPDILYYQSITDPDRNGIFIIKDIQENTKIDVEKEIVGKRDYTSSNGITLTNGLLIEFSGQVVPEKYASDRWLVEGVGNKITLTRFADLSVSIELTKNSPEVLFDDAGFDSVPFDDASAYPAQKDYITVAKSSIDSNPWSRYNRWFHRDVLFYAHKINESDFDSPEDARAKRPIIEFLPNLQLYNHGSIAKAKVDYIDDFTSDVFSTVEGSLGYNIDGEELFSGARVLFTADTDSLVKNRIYRVNFIIHNGRRQISLIPTEDSNSTLGDGLLITRGKKNRGVMYHFTEVFENDKKENRWVKSQEKKTVNQPPLFDIFDKNGESFSNTENYPVSTFSGTEILSYKIGTAKVDPELGFKLSYLNIDNVGDIQFEFDLEVDNFSYQVGTEIFTKKIKTGFYKFNPREDFSNGWTLFDRTYAQPILDSVISDGSNIISTDAIDWELANETNLRKIIVYRNGIKIDVPYTRNLKQFTFENSFEIGDIIAFKIYTDLEPKNGYYEFPVGLEKNPLNQDIESFTLGQASDHISSALDHVAEFKGVYPGSNNLRDLWDYQQYSRRFLKHSNLSPLSILLLCDKEINIIKSIEYARKSYTEFKNNFILFAQNLFLDQEPKDFVDTILKEMSKAKSSLNSFANSDMVGNGAFTSIKYTVEDEGIKTFALTEKFDLDTLSSKAIYVYFNNSQLIHKKDYVFDSTFGFVRLLIELSEGDEIEIREYLSTGFNYIPPTPTKLGLYNKYLPQKFIDDTYVIPKEVIQGHDGSITVAYGDFRDDVLLELELRIYNNIKQKYDENIFDIDEIFGGYYGNSLYEKSDLDKIVNRDFLSWISGTNIDYVNNIYFDSENSFTYTYSNMTNQERDKNLPGYWRGVYRWYYDTDRPHRCPWEILGFSEQPDWWEDQYGPAPYTSGNLILWEDIRDGIIRKGPRAGTYKRYQRPTILNHLPVDGDGKLLSPLDSGLADNFTLINNKGSFVSGDISPAEYAYRSSSEYPFSIIKALCLTKTFEFISDNFIKSSTELNLLSQTINNKTEVFSILNDSIKEDFNQKEISGLFVYILDYLKSSSTSYNILLDKIENIDVVLSHRMSGFVDKNQQKFILDSKNPKSKSSSVFIPEENYDVIFAKSTPVASLTYSGVIVEKTETGWKLSGYDAVDPYFFYYPAVASANDPLVTVGGTSENFLEWTPNQFYGNGVLVRYNSEFYRNLQSHTSSDSFENKFWKKLPQVPQVGGVAAFKRRNFNRLRTRTLVYGEILPTVQSVVDFLLGYEEYLKSQGFAFTGYNPEFLASKDWFTASKEFMFWTSHNWSVGSLLTLSPAAEMLECSLSLGVVDNLLDSFYGYQILKADGLPLRPEFINVKRDFQYFSLSTTNTEEGIYFLKTYLILKEHVTIFDDKTVFGDVIYDKPTGYRQERIKARGFRTVDWDGDYTSPGFLFDNVDVQTWQPFTDYKLGDIVTYKSYFWTSQTNQLGTTEFNDAFWTKLDLIPEKGLVSNFDYRISQFEDYYEADGDGIGSSQRDLARHLIGYQPREYLQGIAEDSVSQFKLYQGFIREKGTANSIVKIFDKLSDVPEDKVEINEEWAFLVGKLGGFDQLSEVEFNIDKSKFELNPQPLLIVDNVGNNFDNDQFIRITEKDFVQSPVPFNINLTPKKNFDKKIRSAGYVKLDHVDNIIKTKEDLLTLDIDSVNENDEIWVTFDNVSWDIIRYNEPSSLSIENIEIVDEPNKIVRLYFTFIHSIEVDDYIGIRNIFNLKGFFKVISKTKTSVDVEYPDQKPELENSSFVSVGVFTSARVANYASLLPEDLAKLKNSSRLWFDDDDTGKWKVVEKTKQYNVVDLINYGISVPVRLGSSVAYSSRYRQVISNVPQSGFVLAYQENSNSLVLKQTIPTPPGFADKFNGSFGTVIKLSPDNNLLIVGSPLASGIESRFLGDLRPDIAYQIDEMVFYQGKIWKAVEPVLVGDGSSINFDSQKWEPASIITANVNGRGEGHLYQGMVSVYRFINGVWENEINILSPRPNPNELFGSEVSIGVSGNQYYLAVSAPGAMDDTGRVYIFNYDGNQWKNLENTNYVGVYSSTESIPYPPGTIVWDNGFWQSSAENQGATIRPSSATSGWLALDPISTQSSLPLSAGLFEEDGSTMSPEVGLTDDQLAEIVKKDDQFGYRTVMNRDGSWLIISTPFSDGQFFNNYKGRWKEFQEYKSGDVVKYDTSYYRLTPFDSTIDSTRTSLGEDPSTGDPWEDITDVSSSEITGKVYIYRRVNGIYSLKQTITAASLEDINDLPSNEIIEPGEQFGYSIDIDASGTTLLIGSPQADINRTVPGVVYVFKNTLSGNMQFRLVQKLESYERYNNEYFGSEVKISPNTEKIVIGAKNSPYRIDIRFEEGITFDRGKTRFSEARGFPGQVYVFENKPTGYLLTEKLEADFVNEESFGESIDCSENTIIVGSPGYISNSNAIGKIRLFRKTPGSSSLKPIANQENLVDIESIKNIEIYDRETNTKLRELDIVDHYKLKILGIAEQEISFKTVYDPAVYDKGDDTVTVDNSLTWFEKHVGEIWWDLSTIKFLYHEQGDLSYRLGNWNSSVLGSTVDVYEWVESLLLPSEWSILADTAEGLAEGISGQPKYSNDTIYNTKQIFNPDTGEEVGTRYYYWVKNKTTISQNIDSRKISVATVSSLIENPQGSGLPYISIVDSSKFLIFNLRNVLTSTRCVINIEYFKSDNQINQAHREYQLLTEGISNSIPTESLERKWLDSLIGFDEDGNTVPDPRLTENQKYGLSFRPRQTMFKNRIRASEIVINNINNIFLSRPFSDLVNIDNLVRSEPIPNIEFREFDFEVDNFVDLQQVGTVRVKQAVLRANILNGKIDTIDIIEPGFGYRVTPFIEIEGDGSFASAEITLDNQGKVTSVNITNRGTKYNFANIKIRPFSVLVNSDSTAAGRWSIYSWDQARRSFYRSRSQGFDTARYWNYIDWWLEGYSESSRIVQEINNFYEESLLILEVGDLIRVKEFGSGGWAVFERTEEGLGDVSGNYKLVGRQNGTIQLAKSIYDFGVGYDNVSSFDGDLYDLQPAREFRIILKTIKENIFLDDLTVEWNKLFFSSIRYAYSEQTYIDWAFKTSFIKAVHNVGSLRQKINYSNDNLLDYQRYLEEVKPFRTTIREYVSRYKGTDNTNTSMTDFDLPPVFNTTFNQILPINSQNNRFNDYPWKWWTDNNGFSVVDLVVTDPGNNYTSAPIVFIEGNGSGATGRAFIANGRVSRIQVLNSGTGYTLTPRVFLIGGNGSSPPAKAAAILGQSKVRTFDLKIKFDRLSKTGKYLKYDYDQIFVANGSTAVFELNYPVDLDKNKIRVLINGQIILSKDFTVENYQTFTNGYTSKRGRLTLGFLPSNNDEVRIVFDKNAEIFDSVDRINAFYDPKSGMIGKEISQLMTGVDFGGVQIQGNTFDVTGGWDAVPWYTDNWDSVEPSSDYYYVADGSTAYITLPYIPEQGELITIYLQRSNEDRPRRIDDLYFDQYDGSTIQPNGRVEAREGSLIPTFVGDGSTKVVELQSQITDEFYVNLNAGDTIIFRKIESDGAVEISDINILDTRISGGYLSTLNGAYSTATGLTPEEISITGGKFISPEQVPAPEENVPGQVLDSLSIKVFDKKIQGSVPLKSKIIPGDGVKTTFEIGSNIINGSSLIVYVDKVKKEIGIDYEIDFVTNRITFNSPPPDKRIIEIISVGLGGVGILDYQEFLGDGETRFFLTNARFNQTDSVYVTVNGVKVNVGFINSSDQIDTEDKSLVEFPIAPRFRDRIKIISFGLYDKNIFNNIPLITYNEQTFFYDGSSTSFDIEGFVNENRSSVLSSVLVDINGKYLQGVDTNYLVYDGTNNEIVVGTDPQESLGGVTSGDIKVYINNELKRFVLDYVYDGNRNLIIIPAINLTIGDEIKIENSLRAQYSISGNSLTFADSVYQNLLTNNDDSTLKDTITITWFSEYPSLDLLSDETTGGKIQYILPREPLSIDFVWVYKNGQRLVQDVDYTLSKLNNVLYLQATTDESDLIKTVIFGNTLSREPSSFEIFKDMLNNVHYKRYSRNTDLYLAKNLNYFDNEIEVSDGSLLFNPIVSRKVPGVIIINNERIEYFIKQGNILKQLRRGSLGTSIPELHTKGSSVVDVGASETVPYNESQNEFNYFASEILELIPDGTSRTFELDISQAPNNQIYVGFGDKNNILVKINNTVIDPSKYSVSLDGIQGILTFTNDIELLETDRVYVQPLLIGPLEFVPRLSNRENWIRNTIPSNYGPCDEIEVFVSGTRLRKNPIDVYQEERDIDSPNGDVIVEAEFSVNGDTAYIRLTSPVKPNTKIKVIKRTGKIWYDRGSNSASSGITLLENQNPIANFISVKTSKLPE